MLRYSDGCLIPEPRWVVRVDCPPKTWLKDPLPVAVDEGADEEGWVVQVGADMFQDLWRNNHRSELSEVSYVDGGRRWLAIISFSIGPQ